MSCGHRCECATYREHVASIAFSATAMPSRRAVAANTAAAEKDLTRNRDAYKRLKDDGLRPHTLVGAAELERKATNKYEIERGAAFRGDETKVKESIEILGEST